MNGNTYEYVVTKGDKDMRIDVFLSCRNPHLSRSQIKKAADEGHLRINELRVKAGHRLKEGDCVQLFKPDTVSSEILPQPIPLHIIYEDTSLLVIDKPAGMVVHPAAGNYQDTLVNAILFHCKDLSGIGGILRPGIVHRLDKGTSGLMLVAKSDAAHRDLADQFKKHAVRKTYKALVYGDIKGEKGLINTPVGRHPVDRKKMSTKSRRGKEAITHWRVCERYGIATLLEVHTETGRTHQIRVHLTATGYPLVGDSIYGNPQKINTIDDSLLKAKIKSLGRQALHASDIEFSHPIKKTSLAFSSPLPADMSEVCNLFRKLG